MRGFWTGVAGGGAFILVELLGRTLGGVPTVPELVQDRLVRVLPGPVFGFMLEHLLYLGKPLLFAGLLGAQLILAGLGGLVVGRWGHPFALSAALWLLTGGLLALLTGRGLFDGDVRVALDMLASFGAYALALVLFRTPPPGASTAAVAGADRRRLVGGGVLLLASAVVARRIVGILPSLPSAAPAPADDGTESPAGGGVMPPIPAGLPTLVTPPDAFYVVSKNLSDPEVDLGAWRLRVAGLVDHPLDLGYEDLLALPAVETYRTLECISNEVGGDLMSNGRWTGLRLADLLERAGLQAGAATIAFRSVDGYTETMALAQALDPRSLLAYRLGGQPLPTKHGFPLRVLGAGTYGMKNPKWLTQIDVVASAEPGFWEQQGWDPDAPVQTMARIDTPRDGATVPTEEITVGGVAFAADRGIQRVEVSTDGGASWAEAQPLPSLGPSTWTFWQLTWRPQQPGQISLTARATDGTGQVQTDRQMDTFPQGASGHHTIRVRVTA